MQRRKESERPRQPASSPRDSSRQQDNSPRQGSRRQDNIILVDTRLEKVLRINNSRAFNVFIDGYNLTNANPAANITWSSGSTFLQPVTIIAPRLARFGVKFDW